MTLYNGDCFEILKLIPDRSVDCVITDPPYYIPNCVGGGNSDLSNQITRAFSDLVDMNINKGDYFELRFTLYGQ